MTIRQEKVCALLQNIVSSFISHESIALSGTLISVTKIEITSDFKKAKIFINVFPEDKEKETLNLLKNRLSDLKQYVKTRIKMKFLPFFEIEIDKGEKSRQRIEEILNQ